MKRGFPFRILISIAISGVLFSGCSLDMFSSKSDDPAVNQRKNYRQGNPGCSSFSIPETGLDAKSFRALVECFNSNGSIPEFQALTAKADDRTLSALTHILNGSFFRNESQIGESFVFFNYLDRTGRLGKSVENVTQLFQNPKSIAALMQFLDSARSGALNPNARELKMLSKWVESVTPEGFELYLGVIEKVMRSSEFESIYRAFEKSPLSVDEKNVIRESIQAWVSERPGSLAPTTNTASAQLVRSFARGSARSLFQTLMEDPNRSSEWIDKLILPSAGHAPWLNSFEGLRRGLNSPIVCMGGSLAFKDPWSELVSELKLHTGEAFYNFSIRRGSTQTLILKECCKIPETVLVSYEDLLQGFGGNEGVLFVRLLEAGIQSGLGDVFGKWMDRDSAILLPIFKIFFSRGISESALKIFSLISDTEWEKIGKTLDEFSQEGYPPQLKAWVARLNDDELNRLGRLVMALPGLSGGEGQASLANSVAEIRSLFRISNRHSWWEGIRAILHDSIEGKNEFATLSELSRLPEFVPAVQMVYSMGQDGRLSAMLFDLVRLFAATVQKFPSEVMTAEKWPDESAKRFTLRAAQSYPKPKYAKACSALKLGQSIETQKRNFYDCMGGAASSRELETWVSLLEKRQSSSGGTLSQAIFSRVLGMMKIEFKSESKAYWVGEVLRKKKIPELIESIRDLQFYSKEAFASEVRGIFEQLLSAPQALDRFFDRFTQYVRTRAFVEVNRWVDSARSGSFPIAPPQFRGETDEGATRKMLMERECVTSEEALRARLSELQSDVENAVVGWESVNGRSRQTWEEELLLERMKALQPFLSDPVVAKGVRNALVELRNRHGAGSVMDWFEKRSRDIQPVMFIFPGEKESRVRWMSTLDRLEVLLTDADFKFASWFFEDNFVLKFISEIGESWGDEPRASWPLEIQKKYSGRRQPPTLAETYDSILSFLRKFSNLGGLPKVGQCASAREHDPLMSAPGALVPFWVKAHLYNLKQVLPVYEENLPGSAGSMKDGMRFLRDLFYFVGTSGLEKNRDPSKPEVNPLSIVRALGRLGFLRTSSRYFSSRDPGVRSRDEHALDFVMKLAQVPEFSELLIKLFEGNGENSPIFALTRDMFRLSKENPAALDDFSSKVLPYVALAGDFLQEKEQAQSLLSVILDSGLLTRSQALRGMILLNAELETENLGWKLWKTRAAVSSSRRAELMKFLLSDAEFVSGLARSFASISESPRSRKTIVDASRSSELRRLNRSIQDLFPKATWLGGNDPASEELGLVLRVWIIDSLRALGPDLMRFDVQDSKSFNEFLSALARFSESQSFEEIEELYSRHLPR